MGNDSIEDTPTTKLKFYDHTIISDRTVDTIGQLLRRIDAIEVTPDFIRKSLKEKKTKHTDQDNA